jgi:beta-barrel assembly-enhancing protease
MTPQVAYPTGETSTPSESPTPSRAAADLGGRWDNSMAGLRAQDQRVADVAYRIVTANAALCTDLAPQTGLVLQSALQFSPRLRSQAEAFFHIDDRPAVEAIAAGSPAAGAGLQWNDIIVAVDGEVLPRESPLGGDVDDRAESYQPVARALARIGAALAQGPAMLTIQRGQARLQVSVPRQMGCAYDAQVIPGPQLNASADGRHVFISTGLVSYTRSDDMLALVLGHEFAHDVLHHHDRLDQKGFARNVLGELGSTPQSLNTAEREADYVGLYLTARAGYDISQAPDFWRQFPESIGDFGWSHPGGRERAASLAATRDEILRKQRDGAPLTPTPAGG